MNTSTSRGLLNGLELFAMNNPVRRLAQRHWELRRFEGLLEESGINLHCARILDAGCGSGFGMQLIAETFGPARLVGIDAMAEQVTRAKERMRRASISAEVRLGDLTTITEPDESFDAVFVFAVLHHVPAWRAAVHEIARVLAPGGVLVIEELRGSAALFSDTYLGTLHPRDAAFSWDDMRAEISNAGLRIRGESRVFGEAVRAFLARKETHIE